MDSYPLTCLLTRRHFTPLDEQSFISEADDGRWKAKIRSGGRGVTNALEVELASNHIYQLELEALGSHSQAWLLQLYDQYGDYLMTPLAIISSTNGDMPTMVADFCTFKGPVSLRIEIVVRRGYQVDGESPELSVVLGALKIYTLGTHALQRVGGTGKGGEARSAEIWRGRERRGEEEGAEGAEGDRSEWDDSRSVMSHVTGRTARTTATARTTGTARTTATARTMGTARTDTTIRMWNSNMPLSFSGKNKGRKRKDEGGRRPGFANTPRIVQVVKRIMDMPDCRLSTITSSRWMVEKWDLEEGELLEVGGARFETTKIGILQHSEVVGAMLNGTGSSPGAYCRMYDGQHSTVLRVTGSGIKGNESPVLPSIKIFPAYLRPYYHRICDLIGQRKSHLPPNSQSVPPPPYWTLEGLMALKYGLGYSVRDGYSWWAIRINDGYLRYFRSSAHSSQQPPGGDDAFRMPSHLAGLAGEGKKLLEEGKTRGKSVAAHWQLLKLGTPGCHHQAVLLAAVHGIGWTSSTLALRAGDDSAETLVWLGRLDV